MSEDHSQLVRDVYQLKAEVSQINILLERMDVTIDKLTQVSTTVSQLLAVQANKIETQQKIADHLVEDVTKLKSTIVTRIDQVEAELYSEIERKQQEILEEIKSIRQENMAQHQKMDNKFANIERWIWLVSGGAVVVGFIISKIVSMIKFG